MDSAPWPLAGRVALRFGLVYLVLLFWPFPFSLVPGVGERLEAFTSRPLVPWVARHVLHLPEPIAFENGSGDKTWDYVWAFTAAALALAVAGIWSLLARRITAYPRLLEWLRVLVRTFLVVTMIIYGCVKLIPSQFTQIALDKLLERYGEASPMGLLWTFMGHSRAYLVFTGAAEALGGALLLFRRTALLGALLSAAVLAHIVALNFCFDVPVKLFSSHLLAMALFLLLPDLRRLADVLLFHRAVRAAEPRPLFRLAGHWSCPTTPTTPTTPTAPAPPRSPLRGVWAVDEFTIDGQPRPPLLTDPDRWSHVTFDSPRFVVIRDMRDKRRFYGVELDETTRTLTLTDRSPAD